ncbi:MAG TPA: class I adenylate-forming enzyme family protein [Candidatus Udaeobacter sp.]|nr:class I adenylate-forming enzyme family protein [Candidatus Udaeobacter sp.]
MKSSDPLLEAWEKTLARRRDRPAIFATSGEVIRTFLAIEEHARAVQTKMPPSKPFNVNAIQIGNHADWPSLFLACLRTQRVVLPIDESVSKQHAEAAFAIAAKSGTADWGNRPPALFKLTSGTTAAPRLVRFRSEQLLADCNQICDTMEISDADLNFGVIPISHSYGFSNLLTPLVVRGVPMVISRDRTPRAILADLARTNATVFPGMPVFYQAFCEIEHVPVLPKLRLYISAGAPLSIAVAKKFRGKFNLPIHSFYGASECGGICYDREATNPSEGFVGEAMKGVNLEIVDLNGSATQIRVRSAAVGDGYFPEPDKEKLSGGIFVPDDLLARDGSGFKIVGRISDVINVAGKKVNPAEVEAHLLRFTGVRQAVVFGRESALRNEEVLACVVAAPDVSETDLLQFCRGALSTWQVPKRIFIVAAIPANERGKISRRDLSRRFSTTRERSSLP